MGRKSGHVEWEKAEKIVLIKAWARDGKTDDEIAELMEIDRATLYRWRKKSEVICNALKINKEIADSVVETSLYKLACEGNLGAICFWLKNRRPDKWRDRQEFDISKTDIPRVVVTLAGVEGTVKSEEAR